MKPAALPLAAPLMPHHALEAAPKLLAQKKQLLSTMDEDQKGLVEIVSYFDICCCCVELLLQHSVSPDAVCTMGLAVAAAARC
jgi:hypothetical protein